MGCYNQTCGVSNLHITADEEVVIFGLTKSNYEESYCYPNTLWDPFPLPFYGSYNDYGAAEDCHGPALDVIISELKEYLVEKDLGENQYRDMEIKKDKFDIDLFFEACHNRRLEIDRLGKHSKVLGTAATPVLFMMIHKKIFDKILSEFVYEMYIGPGEYRKYKFQDILNDLPAWVDRLHESFNTSTDEDRMYNRFIYTTSMGSICHRLEFERNGNLANEWLKYDDATRQSFINIQRIVVDYIENNQKDKVIELLTEHLKMLCINGFLSSTRKMWQPQSGQGSQNSEHDAYRFLCKAMTEVMDEEDKEYADENG